MTLHKLDAYELDELLKTAGFPAEDVPGTTSPVGLLQRRSAWAKAMAESGGYFDIIGGPNPNGTFDYGLFQINEIHKADKAIDWTKILDAKYNAAIAARFTGGGKDWSSWGLGMSGWAGSLYVSNNAAWVQVQTSFKKWYDRYPADVAAAKAIADLPKVKLENLVPGTTYNADVRTYQGRLRMFLVANGVVTRPSAVLLDGIYGANTKKFTEAAYRYLAAKENKTSWLRGDLTTPGASLLVKLGLRS
jgi:hypothetical protein